MKAMIWHNPRCSRSRETLRILEAAGAEVTVVEYLKVPPSRDEAALDRMARHPATIERPPERVRELL